MNRPDIYTTITNKIVSDLERGVRPWMRPWNAGNAAERVTRPLRHNGIPYSGINIISLWLAAAAQGFDNSTWMSFRQAQELGGNVRKGEHGSLVVYANRIKRTEKDDKGDEVEREIPFLKGYTVFNALQCEGLPAQYTATVTPPVVSDIARIEHADAFFAATKITVRHGGNRAYYAEGSDHIQMPPFETFKDAESYTATLAHESIHATKHKDRLSRDMGRVRWGDEGYSKEELVAELGSAFLCADLKITPEVRDDHASYIASWLKVLNDDKRLIFTAAAHAQKAAEFLHALQPKAYPEPSRPISAPESQLATQEH